MFKMLIVLFAVVGLSSCGTVAGIGDDDRFCVNEGRAAVYVRHQNRVWGDKIKYRYRADYAEWLDDFDKSKEYNWIFRRTEWAS